MLVSGRVQVQQGRIDFAFESEGLLHRIQSVFEKRTLRHFDGIVDQTATALVLVLHQFLGVFLLLLGRLHEKVAERRESDVIAVEVVSLEVTMRRHGRVESRSGESRTSLSLSLSTYHDFVDVRSVEFHVDLVVDCAFAFRMVSLTNTAFRVSCVGEEARLLKRVLKRHDDVRPRLVTCLGRSESPPLLRLRHPLPAGPQMRRKRHTRKTTSFLFQTNSVPCFLRGEH